MRAPASLQATLSRWFALQTLIGLSLVCALTYAATHWSLQRKHDEELERHAEIAMRVLGETAQPLDMAALRHKLDDYFQSHAEVRVTLAIAGTEPLYVSGLAAVDRQGWLSRQWQLNELRIGAHPVALRMDLDIRRDALLLQRLAWTLLAAATLGTALISLTGAVLLRRGLRPLKTLAEETGAVGPDQPGRRIAAHAYASELQPWIAQFNDLLGRVEAAYAQLEAFNADVAHELRTPISNLLAHAEVELGRDRPAHALREVLESQVEEVRRLSQIVGDMLFMSKADRGAKARRGSPCSLAEQVQAVADFQEAALEDAQLQLRIHGDARLAMDIGLLRRAVSNLVSNALRYAPAGSLLQVRITTEGPQVRLTVCNDGPDIPPDALPHLFERFYRVEASRTGSAAHHGLGLAIVAAIARMHDGQTFASSQGGRTCIGLSLHDPSRANA